MKADVRDKSPAWPPLAFQMPGEQKKKWPHAHKRALEVGGAGGLEEGVAHRTRLLCAVPHLQSK